MFAKKAGGKQMANQKHLDIIKQSVETWNQWREEHTEVKPDLRGANLSGALLSEANLSEANLTRAYLSAANLTRADLSAANLTRADLTRAVLRGANLRGANLSAAYLWGAFLSGADLRGANLTRAAHNGADLSGADLRSADLNEAHFYGANLRGADLREATLNHTDLTRADLTRADLRGADLTRAALVETNLTGATLTQCSIYGISVWRVQLEGAKQDNLVITSKDEPTITVDNLNIAQFLYLLLNNAEIRDAIDTIAKKAVLILGRFTSERKAVLDALREALRIHGYLPILFDFDKPASKTITETVSTLAHLARFVIADITDAKSIPQELMAIVPTLPSLAVQPLILASQHEFGMFEYFTRFPWVLPLYRYADEGSLLQSLQEKVITPAEQKAKELEKG
jgi:uncharacterized protein YjbI with pentapeptide repeats